MKILVKVPCPAMGDSLCATPTIKKISESYGHKIDVMAVRTDVFENNPYIENLLESDIFVFFISKIVSLSIISPIDT
jgi:hypothetical protein